MLVFPPAFAFRSAVDPGVCCSEHPPFCKRDQLRADTAHRQVEAISHLDRTWCSLATALGVRTSTIADDDLDARMLAEPPGEHLGGAVVQQVNRSMPFEIHQDSVESKVNTFFNTGYPQPEGGRRVVRTKHQD